MNFSSLTPRQVALRLQNGRLRPKKSEWDLDEALAVAKMYKTRGELYAKNKNLYFWAYHRGLLDTICANMKPSRKKNKFHKGVLNTNKVLASVFTAPNHAEWVANNKTAYDLLRYRGIDTQELFENRDNAEYLRNVILELSQDNAARFVA